MEKPLIVVEHEEIRVAEKRNISKKIISRKDKEELFSIIHTDRFNKERYVFSRKGKDGIKANSIVGSISLKSGLIIEILPKFAKNDLTDEAIIQYRETLLRMIQVSNERNFISSTLQSSKISVGEMPLIRYMIELFSESLLFSLRNSIVTTYNKKVENSSYIRGNVLLTKTIQNNFIDKSKVYISYNKHSSNNLLMQIFKTLAQLLLNDTNLSYRAKQYLYEVYVLLDSVDVIPLKQHHFDKVIFNRLNDKYEILFRQAEFIFNQYMPFTSNINSTPFWAILFDMNYLFEKFCAYLFRKSDIDIEEQSSVNCFQSSNKIVSAKPDFIIKSQVDLFNTVNICVVDAKWKLLTNDKSLYGLNAQNFWQLFSYMNLKSHNEEIHGYFIVPKDSDEFDDEIVFESIIEGNKSITILSIDFSLSFEELIDRYSFKIINNELKVNFVDIKQEIIHQDKEVSNKDNEQQEIKVEEEEFQFDFEDFIKELETLHNNKNLRKKLSPSKKDEKFKNLYYLKEVYNANSSVFKQVIKENLSKASWNFTGLEIDTIPSNILKLKNIQFLNLSNNKIKDLPIELFRLKKLLFLDISKNSLNFLPTGLFMLKSLKRLTIDKKIVSDNTRILQELKEKGIQIEDAEANNLSEYIDSFIKLKEIKENPEKKSKNISIQKTILNVTVENYKKMTKEEKINFVNEGIFSKVSVEVIKLIMKEIDIDILEDFTYNQTLPLEFAFVTYNNNLDRKDDEVKRLKENLLKRKNQVLNGLLELNIFSLEIHIEKKFLLIDKEILLGYTMSSIKKLQRIREKISKLTNDLDILNELSKHRDEEDVLWNIVLKNNKNNKKFVELVKNKDSVFSLEILDRISRYEEYYKFENDKCLITRLAHNYSLTEQTKEYLFEKYRDDNVFLETLSKNHSSWELQSKIENVLYGLDKQSEKKDKRFNGINFY